jgi:hypothetical protein
VRRVGAGSRGVRGVCKDVTGIDESFSLQVLAPESIGQTLSKQPTLYWSVSTPVSGKFLFTVAEESRDFPEPVLDKEITMTVQAGIQTLPLATYGISLKENANYKWSVSLQCDTANPSLTVIASGMIKVVTPATDMEKSFKQASEETLPYLYAEHGYWYDALISLTNLIEKSRPNDQKWREAHDLGRASTDTEVSVRRFIRERSRRATSKEFHGFVVHAVARAPRESEWQDPA